MVEIEINGDSLSVEAGSNVLEAALAAGHAIPHFCYHKKLSVTASCRMCLVEVEGSPRLQPACATPAESGMKIHTHSHAVTEAQKAVLEFLLINHPLDCPVCDQAGECRLQDLTMGYGNGHARFIEEKRVVMHKEAGPLVSMHGMNRCIHCTRCIRFGQEVAGMQELGMLNRTDHAEIALVRCRILESELSGNLIDVCPVGAILSKPFLFTARNWELGRHFAISPHDSLGSNLIVQTLNDRVMRVLPQEKEAINECWLSDRDRFSYEGLNSAARLTRPMVKQDNAWIECDWEAALSYVVHGLKDIRNDEGSDALAALASPQATLEELYLLKKLMNGLGSANIEFRQRQCDFSLDGTIRPWLGMPVADIDYLGSAFIIGSYLREEQPLLAARFRRAASNGTVLSRLHAEADDWLMPVEFSLIDVPSHWPARLAEVAAAVAALTGQALPGSVSATRFSETAQAMAVSLLQNQPSAIFMGQVAASHPASAELHRLAEWIAQASGAVLGYLPEGANATGAYLVCSEDFSRRSRSHVLDDVKACILLHAEPELDAADVPRSMASLKESKMVVVMSAFKHGMDYADVLLPVSPFTETSGTFINAEGRVQAFMGAVRPLGETRPAWKVLRVLGSLLELEGVDFDSSEAVRHACLGDFDEVISERFSNHAGEMPTLTPQAPVTLERISDVPMTAADPLVRRADALQAKSSGHSNRAYLPLSVFEALGLSEGERVEVIQGDASCTLLASCEPGLNEKVVRISASQAETAMLGPLFGPVEVRRR